jgi:hypothetical protein
LGNTYHLYLSLRKIKALAPKHTHRWSSAVAVAQRDAGLLWIDFS